MSLAPGVRLGAYEILSLLGAGGMGEVYRARDTRLKREVAIKVLPDAFASDPERLARFQREAELLATLNHPNIGAVYGFEQSPDANALVLELVEGETLADRIARGPLPLEDALAIAKQIAEALEAAHDRGVVHRDLKPANIKVTPDGQVKVLDFGLAKVHDQVAASSLSMSPTLSLHATNAGVILGTAAYMSPEQARGKPVDRRADIWSFGCVLFEMLTGKQPFDAGDTVSDAVAAILRGEPDWTALPRATPVHIRALVRRCLQKDPHKRLPHIGVARLEIEEGSTTYVEAVPPVISPARSPQWKRLVPIAAGVLLFGAVSASVAWYIKPLPRARVMRLTLHISDAQITGNRKVLVISPDGAHVAYFASRNLYVRGINEFDAMSVFSDTTTAHNDPTFSPDGRSLAFWTAADNTIKKIALTGGPPVTICRADIPLGMSWTASGLLFAQRSGIMRVSNTGGSPELLVAEKPGEIMYGPQMLPDDDSVLFTRTTTATAGAGGNAHTVVRSLKSGGEQVLIRGGADARYVPTGHLVYATGGTLFAVRSMQRHFRFREQPFRSLKALRGHSQARLPLRTSVFLKQVRWCTSRDRLQHPRAARSR